MQSLQQYFLLIKLSKDCSFHEIALHKFSIDLSQNLTPEPSPTKTLSDIINCQPQQSLKTKVSIVRLTVVGSFTSRGRCDNRLWHHPKS